MLRSDLLDVPVSHEFWAASGRQSAMCQSASRSPIYQEVSVFLWKGKKQNYHDGVWQGGGVGYM